MYLMDGGGGLAKLLDEGADVLSIA